MLGWFFKKSKESSSEVHPSIKNSFHNIKQDMAEITKWIHHFHGITGTHQSDIQKILERLEQIEEKSGVSEQNIELKEENLLKSESSELDLLDNDLKNWDQLTNSQQVIAWRLFALNNEEPKAWLSLKRVARECYSNKEYSDIRSTLTQYLNVLEDFGYIERKRSAMQSVVRIKKTKLPPLRIPSEIDFETKTTKNQRKTKL